ncbi:hypothetical protein P8891_06315 [Bacillus atrophaeus]|uniref:hypothetical protein n=1 Tax=Bacillus atrophaeus TaxID=1452 RepID=UPI00227EDEC9|nr:hypothetical protein [Bacillus atrophaeus]MCY7948006.1 hypothetical protein [Bacillus atrophaeus]MCY8098049.1 hypothetical protein [Bacillus atrophaeus]MCY9169973.1 hypothetical protein [Bacillus atrophaeus]MEC0740698.1 hypothetical protein [Bacillus atrophaeus]MEC0747038.1 hypothetical protein [Bacillus atrophaeus]
MGDRNSWSRASINNQRLSQEEFDLLSLKYGLKYRSISEFESLSIPKRKWVLAMMAIAYKRGEQKESGNK